MMPFTAMESIGGIISQLGCVGLLLAIPLGIAANLLTPKVQEWLASRSVRSARSRLHRLERYLVFIEKLYCEPSTAAVYCSFEVCKVVVLTGIFVVSFTILAADASNDRYDFFGGSLFRTLLVSGCYLVLAVDGVCLGYSTAGLALLSRVLLNYEDSVTRLNSRIAYARDHIQSMG